MHIYIHTYCGLCHILGPLILQRTCLIKICIKHLILDLKHVRCLMLQCITLQLFSSTDEKHPCPDEKSNSEFSLPKFTIISCQLLWLYVSTVWLPVLQQPPPGCAESLAEHGVSSKTSLCLHCVTAASLSVHVLSQT